MYFFGFDGGCAVCGGSHQLRAHHVRKADARILALGVSTIALYLASHWVTRADFVAGRTDANWHIAIYTVATLLLFLAYGEVLAMGRRGELAGRRARLWALAVPCVLHVLLVACIPYWSEDVFSYMAHGFLGVLPGGNPLTRPAEAAANTLIGPHLAVWGWHGPIGITPYGIVWTQIEIAVMKWGGTNVATALILMKSVVAAASLATGYLIWIFLGMTRPSMQLLGTVAYLWNPVILGEFAAEGHNDAIMVCFVMATLAACAAQRTKTSMVAQCLAVLTKYLPVLFLPAHLVYLWRQRRSTGRLVLEILSAAVVVGAVAAVLYAPLWAGAGTFEGLLERGQPISSASPFGGINWVFRRSPLASHASLLTLLCVTVPLLACVAWASLRVNDAAGLARAFAWISLAYVLFAAPDYWPWYACMPITLMIVADTQGFLWLVMLMSVTARLCAPLDLMRAHGIIGMVIAKGAITGLGESLPLALLLVWLYRERHRLRAPTTGGNA
jgi:alpha-1,6-mannosyltransferase